MRPKQWVKNFLVLAPLLFAGEFTAGASVAKALLAMIWFCLAASATYIFNDLRDLERDKNHAVKSLQRPLASGQLDGHHAWILLGIICSVLLLGFFILPQVMPIIALYIGLNIAYTLVLKKQPVIDIFVIATGFVLRIFAGAVALSVAVSSWMFVTTLCLALFLASIKRRQELINSPGDTREVLEHYSVALINRYAEMSATGALLFYSLYVITAQPALVVTIPFVLFGLFRYWYVVERLGGGESPTDALVSDWQLLGTVLSWAGICAWTLSHGTGPL